MSRREIRREVDRFSGLRSGVPRTADLKGWHPLEPVRPDSGKSSSVRTKLLRERRSPTEEELYWLQGWERRLALLGSWAEWEEELSRRESSRVEEHGGKGWRGDAMRDQLGDLKKKFEPVFRRYGEFLHSGDLDDPRCHLAMVVVQMETASTVQQFSRLVQELHRLRGQYEAKLKVEQSFGEEASQMAEEMLRRLTAPVETELEFPAVEMLEGE